MASVNIKEEAEKIKSNIEKVLVGKSELINLVLTALFSGGHVLLDDVPGTGKTVLAKSLAKSINIDFKRIQFTPDLLPSDVTGLNYYNQKVGEFVFRKGPVFTNIVLADEINRATPRTQSSLLECMEEKQVTIDGNRYEMSNPFFVIATQNPVETIGTFPLPQAQLDRFVMKLKVGFPDINAETDILERYIKNNPLEELQSVIDGEKLIQIMEEVKNIYVHPQLMQYLVKIVNSTRECQDIIAGVSTRGTIKFMRAAQSYAAISGRTYVTPEDIKYLAVPVLSHRIIINSGYDSNKKAEDYIQDLVNTVEVPIEDFKS